MSLVLLCLAARLTTVSLDIDARGEGRSLLTYEWKKVGSDSLPDTASGGNSTELTITSVTSSDSGLYYCIVMNQWGTMVKSNNAIINVLCELKICIPHSSNFSFFIICGFYHESLLIAGSNRAF